MKAMMAEAARMFLMEDMLVLDCVFLLEAWCDLCCLLVLKLLCVSCCWR